MGSNKENEQTDQVQLLHQQKLINNPPIPQPVKKAEAFDIALSPPPASKVPTPSIIVIKGTKTPHPLVKGF